MGHETHLHLIPKRQAPRAPWDSDTPVAYDVGGLPSNLAVEIAEIDGRWQLVVRRDGITGDWQGDFESPDAALAAIAAELNQTRRS
jgi:hypothetical protein